MARLLILGAGGHGKVVAEIALLMHQWDKIAFLDDNKNIREVNSFPVVGKLNDYSIFKNDYSHAFVAIGDNILRLNLIEKLYNTGFIIPTLIHPFTAISSNSWIDEGTVIMAGAVINTNSKIGRGCIINTSSSIDHDCILKDGVHISPGVHVGGTTHIDKNTWVCIGSSIANNITIGRNVVIASGATVIDDVPSYILVGGVPAKKMKNMRGSL
jgi:sugar O-acyltransferase (sialic acid O-acetyltransferase NeuD family)